MSKSMPVSASSVQPAVIAVINAATGRTTVSTGSSSGRAMFSPLTVDLTLASGLTLGTLTPAVAHADPHGALDKTFDLFLELGATDDQADFAVVYGSAMGSFAVEKFSNERTIGLTRPEIESRVQEFHRLVAFEAPLSA